jgi:ubiquinone/menaquinone biosynthesis C-methylase UbiE
MRERGVIISRRRTPVQETIYRLDGPLRWAMGENDELVASAPVRLGQRVLDVGAGTGFLTLPLAEVVGGEGVVEAVDLNSELLSVLADKVERHGLTGRVRCHVGHADDLPFPEGTFDHVFCSYLLHELGDRAERALAEMARVLTPSGRVVLADYRRVEDQQLWAEIESWYAAQADGGGPDEVHLRFSLGDLERMMVRAGLRVLSLRSWKVFHMHAVGRR